MVFARQQKVTPPSAADLSTPTLSAAQVEQVPQFSARGSFKKSAKKAIATGKSWYGKAASRLSPLIGRVSPEHRTLPTSPKAPSVLSETSNASAASTAPTDYSEQTPPKKNKLSKVRKRLMVKCMNLLQPLAIKVLQNGDTNGQFGHHGQQENQTTVDPVQPEPEVENNQENDDDSDDDDDLVGPRCDFGTIGATLDSQFEEIVRSNCAAGGDFGAPRVTDRCFGTFNYVAFVDLPDGDDLKQYVIRVPGHGTMAHWRPEDAYILLREVDMLNNVRNNTTVPVPEVVGFATDHDNALGLPYIMMTKLPGQPAYDIWFDTKQGQRVYTRGQYRMADHPSIATERKRVTFLRSLAHVMTALQTIKSDKIGMLQIEGSEGKEPSIGPTYQWPDDGGDVPTSREPATSTQKYARTALDALKPKRDPGLDLDVWIRAMGGYEILELVFRQSVFDATKQESFTIHHNDLDLQNILVDDDGNVTGIIDWDNSYMAPRCIGAAAVPVFLRNDWFPYYLNNLENSPYMAWNTDRYHEIYAAAMVKAGNDTDAKYTLKSAMYQAAFAAITEGGNGTDFIRKLLHQIPHMHAPVEDFKFKYRMRWPSARGLLGKHFAKIFEPELPRPEVMKEIEDEMALGDWLLEFEELPVKDEVADAV